MKIIKLLADIDQPFDMKSGTILVVESYDTTDGCYVCHGRNFKFNVNVNDADELNVEEYLDVVEHINKL
jgi:hypothetical protein